MPKRTADLESVRAKIRKMQEDMTALAPLLESSENESDSEKSTSSSNLAFQALTNRGNKADEENKGLLSLFGRQNDKPIPPVNLAADFGGGGLICALGITLALFERTRSNAGQIIDAAMVEGTAYLGSWLYRSHGIPGVWVQPRGKNLLDMGAHFYDTYETKDGRFMAVGALEPQFYSILLEKLGIPEDELPQFDDWDKSRVRLSKIFKEKTQDEWCTVFDGTDACVTPVLSLESAPENAHNLARNSFTKSKQDESNNYVPNPAPKLSRTPGYSKALDKSGPEPGENSIDVLTEFGYKPNEIQGFIKRGVVYQTDLSNKL